MKRYFALTSSIFAVCAILSAQDTAGRIVVPARNGSRPRVVKASTMNASITVKTHSGSDVIIETPEGRSTRRAETAPPGMHRIDMPNRGLTITEEDNVIT